MQNKGTISVGEFVDKLEPSYMDSENVKWYSCYWKRDVTLQNVNYKIITLIFNLGRYIPRLIENRESNWYLYATVYWSTIYNRCEVDKTQCPLTDKWNKQAWHLLYNTALFSHKKKWNSDTCYNVNGPWKHYAEWNKLHTKGQILYDFTYVKCKNVQTYRERKSIRGYHDLERGENGESLLTSHWVSVLSVCDECLQTDTVMAVQHCTFH